MKKIDEVVKAELDSYFFVNVEGSRFTEGTRKCTSV